MWQVAEGCTNAVSDSRAAHVASGERAKRRCCIRCVHRAQMLGALHYVVCRGLMCARYNVPCLGWKVRGRPTGMFVCGSFRAAGACARLRSIHVATPEIDRALLCGATVRVACVCVPGRASCADRAVSRHPGGVRPPRLVCVCARMSRIRLLPRSKLLLVGHNRSWHLLQGRRACSENANVGSTALHILQSLRYGV